MKVYGAHRRASGSEWGLIPVGFVLKYDAQKNAYVA